MRSVVTAIFSLSMLTLAASAHAEPNADVAPKKPLRYEESPTGGVLSLGVGARYMSGALSKDAAGASSLEMVASLRGGYYFTQHFGLLTGLELGVGDMFDGCVGPSGGGEGKCRAVSAKLPLVVQYAFKTRTDGAFLEGGLALASTQLFTADNGAVLMFSPADLSVGFGHRWAFAPQKQPGNVGGSIFEMGVRGDGGQYWFGSAAAGGKSASGLVPVEARTFHVAVALNFAFRF